MAVNRQEFLPKYAGATCSVVFDFTSDLASSETIDSAVVTCTEYSGTDASPSSMVSGADSTSGYLVSQLITGGVVGNVYELLCTITTSLGQTLTKPGFLAVIPDL